MKKFLIVIFAFALLSCEKDCSDIPELRIVNDWKIDVAINVETLDDGQEFDIDSYEDRRNWTDKEWTRVQFRTKLKPGDEFVMFLEHGEVSKIHFTALIDTSCYNHTGICRTPGTTEFFITDDCDTKEYFLDDPELWHVIYNDVE